MEPLSFASFTLAAVLAGLPANGGEPISQSVITTHIRPAIAGQWEIDLDYTPTMNDNAVLPTELPTAPVVNEEPSVSLGEPETTGGVLAQNERRTFKVNPSIAPSTSVNTNVATKKPAQCRELYNFGSDNEVWTVSGKEWTYGRYLVTHREEGLPIIAIKTVFDNNEVDCSGNQIDQTDEALIAFLDHDGDQMQWCADPDGRECFMRFRRVLP
ncbi:hypothetical protein [uncultured Psychrobacter sp.]|uniref:hypothetical protein n=1 Tax=uncultured Psychrobacter sp. TaxID=259303 RepID=UPI003459A17C